MIAHDVTNHVNGSAGCTGIGFVMGDQHHRQARPPRLSENHLPGLFA
jgi:hypothetical protein